MQRVDNQNWFILTNSSLELKVILVENLEALQAQFWDSLSMEKVNTLSLEIILWMFPRSIR